MHKKAQIGFGLFCWILFGVLLFNVLTKSPFVRLIDAGGFDLTAPVSKFKSKQSITVRIEKIGIMSYRKW